MNLKEMLFELCNSTGVCGFEKEALSVAEKFLRPYCKKVERLPLGSLYAVIREHKEGEKNIMLEAHIDEIGFIVTSITDEGFLKFAQCGGFDSKILPATEVCVHGKEEIFGIISCKPPHLLTSEEKSKSPKIDEMFIDIGMTKQEAEKALGLGDRITISIEAVSLFGDRVSAKALDDRSGVAAVLNAINKLEDKELNCGVSVLFSTQEEISGKGAMTGGFYSNADIAICVDVSFGMSIGCDKNKCGKLGSGVMIGIAPTLDKNISDELKDIAKRNNIPYQIEVMGGKTSTDADKIAISKEGVKASLCSIPQKHMHTPVEIVDLKDIESVSDLLVCYICENGGKN